MQTIAIVDYGSGNLRSAAKAFERAAADGAGADIVVTDDVEAIRRRRLAQLQKDAEDRAKWSRAGHGTLHTLTEKDFFGRAKESDRILVIFHRSGSSRIAQDFQEHIARIAERHMETFFAVIDAEKSQFLCNKFQIRVLPSVMLCVGGNVKQLLHGLDRIAPSGKFNLIEMEQTLFDLGILTNTNMADDA